MKPISEVSKDKSNQQIDSTIIIEAYKHINDMYKFYTNLRFILLGASIGTFSYILTNYENKDTPYEKKLYILLGVLSCAIFFLMDLRTKYLFRETRAAGKDIENIHMKIKGFYTHAGEINSFLSHSKIIAASYFIILFLFAYIFLRDNF